MIVNRIVWRLRRTLDLPVFQQMQIAAQHPLAVEAVPPEGLRQRVLRFLQRRRCRGLVRADTEVISQLLCGLAAAQAEQPRHKVNHIASGSAAEAIEVICVQLHAGVAVLVERAAHHTATANLTAVGFGGLRHRDGYFHKFK